MRLRGLASGNGSRILLTAIILLALLFPVLTAETLAGSTAASWKVGRAVVQGTMSQKDLTLKLSLRNEGSPSKEEVRILGRWTSAPPGKRNIQSSELGGFIALGTFVKEVELKRTAIIEVSLASLGTAPHGSAGLEIAVQTRQDVTDGQVVPVN